MKRIVEICSSNQDGTTVFDAVKLRLRGKGSGYKEGPHNKGNDLFNPKNLRSHFTFVSARNFLIDTILPATWSKTLLILYMRNIRNIAKNTTKHQFQH